PRDARTGQGAARRNRAGSRPRTHLRQVAGNRLMDPQQIKRILEAALLASSHPLTIPQLSALFDEFEMPSHDDLARALDELRQDCDGRGIELVEVASGFRYQVRHDVHAFVSRLWAERPSRYSRALLE